MTRTCEICHAPLVKETGESPANHRRRTVCRTKACREARNKKREHKNSEIRKRKQEGKNPRCKQFAGKVTQAMNAFLLGKG